MPQKSLQENEIPPFPTRLFDVSFLQVRAGTLTQFSYGRMVACYTEPIRYPAHITANL